MTIDFATAHLCIASTFGKKMEKIEKSVSRDPRDWRSSLIYPNSIFLYLSILSFIIIFGTETYYRNITGEEGTIYITGFFTWVIGGVLFIALRRRKKSTARYQAWVASKGGKVNERIRIDQSGLFHEIEGYCTSELNWSSLASFKEKKNHIEIVIGGGTFNIPKAILDSEELDSLKNILKQKMTEPVTGDNA